MTVFPLTTAEKKHTGKKLGKSSYEIMESKNSTLVHM